MPRAMKGEASNQYGKSVVEEMRRENEAEIKKKFDKGDDE